MSKALRLFVIAIIGCILQTTLAQNIRIAGVAPDFMIALIVVLTSHSGFSGVFCTSALMIMFYDASVGYVMALNPISYILIALAASALRLVFDKKLVKWKHKSFLIIMAICYFLTMCREIVYAVYLFLIGSQWSLMTLVRVLISCMVTSAMTIPCIYLVRKIMGWHPIESRNKKAKDIDDEPGLTSHL